MMPHGFKNSPKIFRRTMMLILHGLISSCCLVYIDDILIYGEDIIEHDKNLTLVVGRLKKYRFMQNDTNKQIRQEEVVFLGFRISHNVIKPVVSRSQGICSSSEPKTRRELQRFLGLNSYDRLFIKI